MTTTIRKTYKYRLYRCDKRDKYLHQKIDIAGLIWNHGLALQKRYFKLTGKYISIGRIKSHIAKLRMGGVRADKRTGRKAKVYGKKYTYWQAIGSQVVQDVLERLDDGYQRFFKKLAKRPPKFRRVKLFKSITYKQMAGWKLLDDTNIRITGGRNNGKQHRKAMGHIKIQGIKYKFAKHRRLEGTIKTVTIKRDSCNRLWVCLSVVCESEFQPRVMTGETAGLDFGLKTFLIDHTGKAYKSPQFLKQELDTIKQLSRELSRKQAGSKRRQRAKYALSRAQIRVSDKRTDSHYKLAHELCDAFDVIYLEDLNIDGMKRLWGRKLSDLAFYQFTKILDWIAKKRGVEVVYIDRFEPTSKVCSRCLTRLDIDLSTRWIDCPSCGLSIDRDHNASLNIKRIGASIQLQEACKTGQ